MSACQARRLYPDAEHLTLCNTASEALDGADALVVITEWQEFRSPDFELIKNSLKDAVVFDGRNLYDPDLLKSLGLFYYAIGRGNVTTNESEPFARRSSDREKIASS